MKKVIIIFSLLLISCSPKKIKEEKVDFDKLVVYFNSFNPIWTKAVRENDPSLLLDRYDEHTIIGDPNKDFITGLDAIKKRMKNFVTFLDDFSYETQYMGGNKDIVFENGLAFATYKINGKTVTDTSKYLFVWKNIGNGQYKVLSELFNDL